MQTKSKTHTLVLTALAAAILCVLSPITIPIGPIPFTLGIFAVCLTGALLPPLSAAAALAVYILVGAVGLPVFSGARGGPQVLVGATGGYIAGYFILAVAIALAIRLRAGLPLQFVAGAAGLALCYLLGTLWYAFVAKTTFLAGLAVCVAPFAIPDLVKLALALGLARLVQRRLGRVRE